MALRMTLLGFWGTHTSLKGTEEGFTVVNFLKLSGFRGPSSGVAETKGKCCFWLPELPQAGLWRRPGATSQGQPWATGNRAAHVCSNLLVWEGAAMGCAESCRSYRPRGGPSGEGLEGPDQSLAKDRAFATFLSSCAEWSLSFRGW